MREIFTEIFENQPLDPMESARRGGRPSLRKRFYERAHVAKASKGGESQILLDDKPVKTPARNALTAPTCPLAEAIAQEWDAQKDVIDPARMPLTRLANAAIDGVRDASIAATQEVAKYLGTDLLCYRADTPAGLVEKQSTAWDPVLAWACDKFGARFTLVEGVMHATQPSEAVVATRAAIPGDPWRLAAVSSITTLTGSALLALAVAHDALDADTAWAAAHVDEDWQMSQWGQDDLALERRAFREAEFRAAATVLRLTR
jgi:chaperone required for assembly of F1-ATPase